MVDNNVSSVILRSLWVALMAVGVGLIPGVFLAFRMSRKHNLFWVAIEYLLYIPLVFPPVVIGWWLLQIKSLHFNIWGAVVAACVVSFPLLTQTIRVAFDQIDPSLEDAIRVDGGGKWPVFRYLYFPLVLPGIVAGAVLAFARALGEFGATIVVAGNIPGETETLPLAIYTSLQRPNGEVFLYPLLIACSLLSITAVLIHAILRQLTRKRLGQM
ncbi:MAG TPA: ABC transporter permease subunit [Rhodothermales bacterium]|nr:ABC transporter permease subunit [Rhodothermales bacterium]HRR07088.1 ABC transporter permease subunit [Rhodothermales bacterium]